MITPDENALRAWHLRELKWSLQALAMPASDQLSLFPQVAAKADELALDFDHWASVVNDNYAEELSSVQIDALAVISQTFKTMSGHAADFEAELWTEDAVRSSSHWDDIRRLAANALEAFGWPLERPSRNPGDRGASLAQ
jgi:hypothetical protein